MLILDPLTFRQEPQWNASSDDRPAPSIYLQNFKLSEDLLMEICGISVYCILYSVRLETTLLRIYFHLGFFTSNSHTQRERMKRTHMIIYNRLRK